MLRSPRRLNLNRATCNAVSEAIMNELIID